MTRRDFYLGSALAFLGLSAGYAVLMAVLGWIEDLTNGWGLHGQMFSPHFLGVAIWSLVPTVIAGVTGFFILRRATPSN